MKKIALILAAVCLGFAAQAQQALFGGPQVASPVVNEDAWVTQGRAAQVLEPASPAIVQAWWNGTEGGTALAEVLFGDIRLITHITI